MKKRQLLWMILIMAFAMGAAGCGKKEDPESQTAKQQVVDIPDEVAEAKVSFYSCDGERKFTVRDEELAALRAWTAGLRLESRTFETGETPADCEGGQTFCVDLGEPYTGFSYYMGGGDDNYILLRDGWYKTVNGGNPFERMGQETEAGQGAGHETAQEASHETGAAPMQADRIPMIAAEGELYLDTGRSMPVEISPSAVLGTISSNVPPTEIPTENGQSNFGCIGAEYARYEDGIAVKLKNEWWYFQKEDILGIQLEVPKASSTGLILACIQSGGRPTGQLFTGSYYWLERKTDGHWAEVETKLPKEQVGWTGEAWNIEMGGTTEWDEDWEWLYGQLEPGHYRIWKRINDFREAGDFDTYDYYGEFVVEG